MARNKEYDRDEVLQSATNVFWDKGFKGTSVKDLAEATGLGKRSMYQEFNSKEGLFNECIEYYVSTISNELKEIITKEPLGLSNIKEFFKNRIEYASSKGSKGCMVVNSAIDNESIDEITFEQIVKHLDSPEDAFYNCLVASQKRGEIPESKDCRELAGFLFTLLTGILAMSRTNKNKQSLEAIAEIAFKTLNS